MPPSRVGWLMRRFLNNNHGSERQVLMHTCPFCDDGGTLAAIISLSCIENWWIVAILNRMRQSMSSLFACFRKARRTQEKDVTSPQLFCHLGKQLSCSFVGLKNWRRVNRKHWSCSDTFIQKSIWPTTSFSSSPPCYTRVRESSLTLGLSKSEPARFANCKALSWPLNEIRPLLSQDSLYHRITITLHNAPRCSDDSHFKTVGRY